jgi:D-inositol-3-phosphate glycosyltransferase
VRIIHFTISYPPRIGGMGNVVKELAQRTAKKGHYVTVVTSFSDECKKTEIEGRLTVLRLRSIRRQTTILPLLPTNLFNLIKRNTIVHVHYFFNYFAECGVILIAKIKGGKIVTHIHANTSPSKTLGFLNPLYKRLIWKNVLPLSDVIICPTQDYVDIAESYQVPTTKCIIVPAGVDTKRFTSKSSFDISTPIQVLFVGRLSKEKNVSRLLEAFKLFQQSHAAVLRIVGEGVERKTIEDFVRNNNLTNVILEGSLIGEKLADAYASSDIFVLTSDIESFGIVNLEAMASGLPIVASDIPGVRNLLEGSAILVKPTPENFAAAMTRLVEDAQLRRELVSKGLEKVVDYDWDKITEKVIDIYRKISN